MDIDAMIAPPRQAVRAGQAVREFYPPRLELHINAMIAPPFQAIRELYPEFVEDWVITDIKNDIDVSFENADFVDEATAAEKSAPSICRAVKNIESALDGPYWAPVVGPRCRS
eukprot:scaffold14489_cov76-Cyclotella_meneghiniana.AAC.1